MNAGPENGGIELRLSVEELRVIHQALNEVCNGFDVPDFEQHFRAPPEVVEREFSVLKSAYKKAGGREAAQVTLTVTEDQVHFYRQALTETLKEIEDPGFATRMGAPRSFAEALLQRLPQARP
jgi:hypothetical protein